YFNMIPPPSICGFLATSLEFFPWNPSRANRSFRLPVDPKEAYKYMSIEPLRSFDPTTVTAGSIRAKHLLPREDSVFGSDDCLW
ncbi:Hypothetical protein FKW44_020669, partial [Caligus rogercresseyi]